MTTLRALVLACMLIVPAEAAEPALSRFAFEEPHMGTLFRIIVYAQDAKSARMASKEAFARVSALNAIMSDYLSTSELMRLCRKAGGEPVKVSAELFFVLDRAQKVSRDSEGAFDVTVGPVVRLWRLARRSHHLPDAKQLEAARALVGYRNVVLDEKARTVKLLKPGMQLDLGGIAKGYAADEALKVLAKHGLTQARWSPRGATSPCMNHLPARPAGASRSPLSMPARRASATWSWRTPPSRRLATRSSTSRSTASAILTSSIRERELAWSDG